MSTPRPSARSRTGRTTTASTAQVQRTESYTGIDGINQQDRALQESMGRIVDSQPRASRPGRQGDHPGPQAPARGGEGGRGRQTAGRHRHQLLHGQGRRGRLRPRRRLAPGAGARHHQGQDFADGVGRRFRGHPRAQRQADDLRATLTVRPSAGRIGIPPLSRSSANGLSLAALSGGCLRKIRPVPCYGHEAVNVQDMGTVQVDFARNGRGDE